MFAVLASFKMRPTENLRNAKSAQVVILFQTLVKTKKSTKSRVIASSVDLVKLVIQAHNFAMLVPLEDDRL